MSASITLRERGDQDATSLIMALDKRVEITVQPREGEGDPAFTVSTTTAGSPRNARIYIETVLKQLDPDWNEKVELSEDDPRV